MGWAPLFALGQFLDFRGFAYNFLGFELAALHYALCFKVGSLSRHVCYVV